MRATGVINEACGLGDAAHVCLIYSHPDVFRTAAREFAEDGLQRGDRLLCIGDEVALPAMRSAVADLTDAEALIERGGLCLFPLAAAYSDGAAPSSPQQRLDFFQTATRRAIEDGYHGLRVIAEVTQLAVARSDHASQVEWEHLADDYIAQGVGLSALCAYALPTLAHGALRELAAVHPAASGSAPDESFRIYFDADRLVLAGSADSFSAELLERLLTASHRRRGDVVTIDVHALDFIDGRACAAIAGWADTLNMWSAQVRIAGASRIFRRVWQVLGFDTLANTSFAELAA